MVFEVFVCGLVFEFVLVCVNIVLLGLIVMLLWDKFVFDVCDVMYVGVVWWFLVCRVG